MYADKIVLNVNEIINRKVHWDNIEKKEYDSRCFDMGELIIIEYEDKSIRLFSTQLKLLSTLFFLNGKQNTDRIILEKTIYCTIIQSNILLAHINEKEFSERYTLGGNLMVEKNVKIESLDEEEVSYSDDDLYKYNIMGS